MKRFSLIVPTYNEEKNINELLYHLINLNYDKYAYEIIVQDDCSNDRTYEFALTYKHYIDLPEIKVFKNSQNLGIAKNRNEGAKHSNAEIMIHLDADAYYPPNALKIIDKDFILYNLVALSGILLPKIADNPTYLDYLIFVVAAPVWQVIGGTGNLFCIRSDVFYEFNGFREPDGIKGREDLDLWYRLENKYKDRMLIDNLLITYISLRRVRHSKSNKLEDILGDYLKIVNGFWLKKGYGRVD
jgi:glycosyltransferase involved in cell wall biosynthesis